MRHYFPNGSYAEVLRTTMGKEINKFPSVEGEWKLEEVFGDSEQLNNTQKVSVVIGEVPDEEVEELKELLMKGAKCGGAQNG